MRLRVTYDGRSCEVASEAAAASLARRFLGTDDIVETPTEDGWQYWPDDAAEDSDEVVTVTVL